MATDTVSKGRHPSTLDNVVVALLRNRLGHRQLQDQLLRLQHEEVSALRMLRTMEHQLCSRFVHTTRAPQPSSAVLARLASTLPPRASLVHAAATTAAAEDLAPVDAKAARVRMFDTHWPGFCYRRDGSRRAPCCPGGRNAVRRRAKMAARDTRDTREASAKDRRASSDAAGIPIPPTSAANFTAEELRSLVMTNGEADIRKVLCLHALGAIAVPCPCGSKGNADTSNRRGSSFRGRQPQCTLDTAFIPNTMPRAGLPCYVLQVEDNRTGAARSAAMWMAAAADEPWTAARALLESSSATSSRDNTFPRPLPGGALPMTVIPLPALRPTPVAGSTATGLSGGKVDDRVKTSEAERSKERAGMKSISKVGGVIGTEVEELTYGPPHKEEESKYPYVKLYVNEEVDALLGSVLQALEVTNPSKLQLARSIAASPSRLTSLLAEPLLLPFLDSLMGTDVLNSRRCFTVKNARLLPASMVRPNADVSSDTAYELRLPACTASADAIRHLISQIRRTLSREPDDEIDLGLGGSKAHAAATRIAMLPLRTMTTPCPLPVDSVPAEEAAPRQLSPPPPPRHAPPRGPMPTPAFAGSLKGPSIPPAPQTSAAVPPPAATDIFTKITESSTMSTMSSPAPPPISASRGFTQATENAAEDEDPRTWQRLLDWRLGRDHGSMTSRVSLAGSMTGTMTGTSYGVKKSLSSLESAPTPPAPALRNTDSRPGSVRLGLRLPRMGPAATQVAHVQTLTHPTLRPLFAALHEGNEHSSDSSVTVSTAPGEVSATTSGQRLAQIRVARARREERHLVDTVRRHLRMLTTDPDQQRSSKHSKRPRHKRSHEAGKKHQREHKLRQQVLGIKQTNRGKAQVPTSPAGAVRPRLPLGGNADEEMVMKEMLGRLSDPQRIMVGLRTAAIKAHKVNMEGVEPKVKSPLAELVAPVLSRASILTLTAPGEDAVRRSLLQAHAAAAAGERASAAGSLMTSPNKNRSHSMDAFRQRSSRFGRHSRVPVFAAPNDQTAPPNAAAPSQYTKPSSTKVSPGRKTFSAKGGGKSGAKGGTQVSKTGAKVGYKTKSTTGTAIGGKSGKSVSMRKSARRIRIRGPDPTVPVAGAGGAAAAGSAAVTGTVPAGGGGAEETTLEALGERIQRPLSATTLTRLRIDVATRETQRKVHNFLKEMNAISSKESAPLERRRIADDKRVS